MVRRTVILLLFCILQLNQAGSQSRDSVQVGDAVVLKKNSLTIAVDPRIELISVVQYLSDYRNLGQFLVTEFDLTYRADADKWFSKSKNHPVIEMFNRMSKGFNHDAPPTTALYLNPDLSLNGAIFRERGQNLVGRAGGKEQIRAFAGALKAFATDSGFPEFYESHKAYYAQIIRQTAESVSDVDLILQLEQYYGEKRNSYTVIISPLLGRGSYGPQIERTEGVKDIYTIMGPFQSREGLPNFGSIEYFNQQQRHELGHSFANPMADRNQKQVAQYAHLFPPMEPVMRSQSYPFWDTVLKESVVRAVTTRLAYLHDGAAAGDRELAYHRSRGFIFTEALAKKLEAYEQDRGKYTTLDSFFPQLLTGLDGFTESSVGELINSYVDSKQGSARNLIINDYMSQVQTLVYELPDDPGRDDAVRYVGKVHDAFFGKLETIDATKLDGPALNARLKSSFVVYTTIGSRLFKAATQPLNIQISGDTLTWNGVSAPVAELRLIIIGKNPYGEGKSLVYAAGSNRLLTGINNCFHGPRSYHIFQGDKLLKEGFYDEKSLQKTPE